MNAAIEPWRPSRRGLGVLAVLWALICAANAAWALWLTDRLASGEAPPVIGAFFFGAALGFMAAVLAELIFSRARPSVRLAVFLAMAFVGTVVATGLMLAIPQYLYYTQWHAAMFSKVWFIQFAFTFAGAFYQFAVVALRFYFPFAFLALLAIGWVLVRPRH